MIKGRDYQIEAVNAIYRYFENGGTGNPVVAMPTGTGKSIVIALFLYSMFQRYARQRVIVLTHVQELIEQNYEKLMTLWPTAPAGVCSAGIGRYETSRNITFGGIGTVAKRAHEFGWIDLILIDECHLVSPQEATQYRKFIAALTEVNPHLKVIGFTATPWRIGQGKIIDDGLFTDICIDLTTIQAFNWFIAQGYLMPLIPKRTQLLLDVEGVHMRGGDYVLAELQNAIDREEITEKALREALETCPDRKAWLIFCAGVEHAQHAASIARDLGVSCMAVHGNLNKNDRRDILEQYKSGQLQAVTNNNVLTTGFDYPAIDLIICLRPTQSPILWVQMLGRGTRPVYAKGYDLETYEGRMAAIAAGGKENCIVLDFSGNTKSIGPINDPVLPRKKGDKKGDAPVKCCDACNTWNHASVRHCVFCGADFFFQTKLKAEASTGELVKGDLPVVEVFHIDHITYTMYIKAGRPPSVKVSYYSKLRSFNEFVCFEHGDFAGRKAREWWKKRSNEPIPTTTEEALERIDRVAVPTHLRVWVNKKYPEIMQQCFDGTAFGTEELASGRPTVANLSKGQKPAEARPADDFDDDIPF